MEYQVLLHRKNGLEAELRALSKRAERKGLPVISWDWGKAYTKKLYNDVLGIEIGEEERIPLTLSDQPMKYNGWDFSATLQHIEGNTIIHCVPGRTVPAEYRKAQAKCDHCGYNRRRNDTFVLQNEDGRYTQVGSSCISDFLGGLEAQRAASLATMLAQAGALIDDDNVGSGGEKTHMLSSYLQMCAGAIRQWGWVSKTQADTNGGNATVNRVLNVMFGIKLKEHERIHVQEEDKVLAEKAEAWAESLSDETLEKSSSDYLHNVRAIARMGLVERRTFGIAASIISAYNRAVMNEQRVLKAMSSTHVGTVGKRETFNVTLDGVSGYETGYGYTTVLRFVTEEGATIVWKASSTDLAPKDVGRKFALTGTVKEHGEYKGAKQTILQRCKVAEA